VVELVGLFVAADDVLDVFPAVEEVFFVGFIKLNYIIIKR
jgi:hypothetical protein